ncbi:MAG: hypothetical protein A3B91_01785 [Candidatus Yanofskybacteria bacterium RIFCSPHIGHO2_02_FULL_41_29]|uniref:Uncharacterized protein n=1 Tax=Candidatus Yanofskybacteria bacterium RIFCSPHIGHO2_01_FULL_41_53 TaxID=1802663 RepID=A0A1F8EJC7_9BACT|nr:MAG: hypothetical protein A2650_04225 [Candidatus Yanofskybacteria bacterium RIFCSPHIGHO2_01_FULL_41_53]OGN11192.1 MAG: hypothetical protein A3B91_01785 [Candidatus Yanofskybacteria bacterium RIFCSPHIGHO2_02_FULL_41_29]OGN16939.1 MAG: hypothetical protein A3F48_00780 [Candidatus Yanofskybacteria bacterium RIFCSPHIGHO2_12_FULL_41_9]OGN22258.1 MAG: hypothetical protein A2916_04030 [Candidatus Yanofskybacteria bacterium RIFCSPLOWO2_01_FULL_41_67]OGN29626.1 MAG: hypothetical protein A3H54_00670 
MRAPPVYFKREPFLNMLLAAVDPFKKECLGYIFGKKPTKKRNSFIVINAIPAQLVKRRLNSEIEQSEAGFTRMDKLFSNFYSLYPVIGDFHSHPEWGLHKGSSHVSQKDIEGMRKEMKKISLWVVISISSRMREKVVFWQCQDDGGVRGSLGRYLFEIKAYCMSGNGRPSEQKPIPLTIYAPTAIKALNRALI